MTFWRHCWAGLRLLLVMTVVLGVAYPAAVWLAAHVVAPGRADGSLVRDASGQVVGSSLLGQSFDGPQWFWARPSTCDYSGTISGGSNLPQGSPEALAAQAARQAAIVAANPDAVGPVPPDALTASASCLDPDISLAYADYQVPRVAAARHLSVADLEALIAAATDRPALGYLGQAGVNVTRLNLALADL